MNEFENEFNDLKIDLNDFSLISKSLSYDDNVIKVK